MLKFKCPHCGCTEIEEIMVNVVQSSVISEIDEEIEGLDYSEVSSEGGEVDRYQCLKCEKVLGEGLGINSPRDLIKWLKKNNYLQ